MSFRTFQITDRAPEIFVERGAEAAATVESSRS
jgi:hypothetical protein